MAAFSLAYVVKSAGLDGEYSQELWYKTVMMFIEVSMELTNQYHCLQKG
jgi:hypothetical protein